MQMFIGIRMVVVLPAPFGPIGATLNLLAR
jgi:hypothetical protein